MQENTAYVIVSNHQSQLDIIVTFRLFLHYKIVSKIEMFKVPFMGWNMSLNRYIKLVRGDKDSIKDMIDVSKRRLEEGSSVFFYPEGTRTKDGEIKSFKPGAFIIARESKVPILPILLNGTGKALPKNVMQTIGVHRIKVRVLDEIPYEKFAHLSVDETSDMVRKFYDKRA